MIAGLTPVEATEGWSALWLATMEGGREVRVLARRYDRELWRLRVRVLGASIETSARPEHLAARARALVQSVERERGWRCHSFVLVLDPRWRRLGLAIGDA